MVPYFYMVNMKGCFLTGFYISAEGFSSYSNSLASIQQEGSEVSETECKFECPHARFPGENPKR